MQSFSKTIAVIGTGGTIAGTSATEADHVDYTAATVGIGDLVRSVPGLASQALELEQATQVDSKDMNAVAWQALTRAVEKQLARKEVAAVVVTHGTDTLEETAYLLQRLFAPAKPLVLTAAMRPSTALAPDGPQNLLDAVTLARDAAGRGWGGVMVTMAGSVHAGIGVRKWHTYRADSLSSGDAGPLAHIEQGTVRWLATMPMPDERSAEISAMGSHVVLATEPADWPRVDIVMNHAQADGRIVRALLAQGVDGIVVAGTGNATVSEPLDRALAEAAATGVAIRRTTRCAAGPVIDEHGALESTAVQLRVELVLALLARRAPLTPPSS